MWFDIFFQVPENMLDFWKDGSEICDEEKKTQQYTVQLQCVIQEIRNRKNYWRCLKNLHAMSYIIKLSL